MPIYEYRCQSCNKDMEVLQKMSDPPLQVCRLCGAEGVEKLMSRNSFHLKGSGWYATDYKSSGAPASAEAAASNGDSKSESKSEPKSEPKSESKSESKSEPKSESKSESRSAD